MFWFSSFYANDQLLTLKVLHEYHFPVNQSSKKYLGNSNNNKTQQAQNGDRVFIASENKHFSYPVCKSFSIMMYCKSSVSSDFIFRAVIHLKKNIFEGSLNLIFPKSIELKIH